MGNCMKTSRSLEEEIEEIREAVAAEFDKENGVIGKGSIKVKIVLTKEELELFLVKLKNNSNGVKVCLEEMEKERSGKAEYSWTPSLESIMEDDVVDSANEQLEI